jgi:hypothetical protein
MNSKSGFVLLWGVVLAIWAAKKTLGGSHLVLDFTTPPQNQADGIGRFTELAPYFAALAGVIVASIIASTDDDAANVVLVMEAAVTLILFINGSGVSQTSVPGSGGQAGGRTKLT